MLRSIEAMHRRAGADSRAVLLHPQNYYCALQYYYRAAQSRLARSVGTGRNLWLLDFFAPAVDELRRKRPAARFAPRCRALLVPPAVLRRRRFGRAVPSPKICATSFLMSVPGGSAPNPGIAVGSVKSQSFSASPLKSRIAGSAAHARRSAARASSVGTPGARKVADVGDRGNRIRATAASPDRTRILTPRCQDLASFCA